MVKHPVSNEDYIALSPVYVPRHNLNSSSSDVSSESPLASVTNTAMEEKTSTPLSQALSQSSTSSKKKKPPPIITDLSPTFTRPRSPSKRITRSSFLSPRPLQPLQHPQSPTDSPTDTSDTRPSVKTPVTNKSSWAKRLDRHIRFQSISKQIPIEYIDNNLMYLDSLVASIKMILVNIISLSSCISSMLITQFSQSPVIKDYFRYIVKRMCELKHWSLYYENKSGQLGNMPCVTGLGCKQLKTLYETFNDIEETVEEEWLSEKEALLQKKKKD